MNLWLLLKRLFHRRPKVGSLMYIDGVIHECVSSKGMGWWHYGGVWIPYKALHGKEYSE